MKNNIIKNIISDKTKIIRTTVLLLGFGFFAVSQALANSKEASATSSVKKSQLKNIAPVVSAKKVSPKVSAKKVASVVSAKKVASVVSAKKVSSKVSAKKSKEHKNATVYYLTIDYKTVNIAGKKAKAMVINDSLPAPTLYFKEGKKAIIYATNKMNVETSIHWHGILLPSFQDGVPYLTTPPILPGQTYKFEFTLKQSGTYWYHSHTGLQEQRGLYGPIVVEPKRKTLYYNKELVLTLSDWTNENPKSVLKALKRGSEWYAIKKKSALSLVEVIAGGALGAQLSLWKQRMPGMDISDVYYPAFLINGKTEQHYPGFTSGEKIRLRVINAAASTYFQLAIGGKPFLVSVDGMDVKPLRVNKLLHAIAETYDFLITLPKGKSIEFKAMAQDGSGFAVARIGNGEMLKGPALIRPDSIQQMKLMAQMHGGHKEHDMHKGHDMHKDHKMQKDHGMHKGHNMHKDHKMMKHKGHDMNKGHNMKHKDHKMMKHKGHGMHKDQGARTIQSEHKSHSMHKDQGARTIQSEHKDHNMHKGHDKHKGHAMKQKDHSMHKDHKMMKHKGHKMHKGHGMHKRHSVQNQKKSVGDEKVLSYDQLKALKKTSFKKNKNILHLHFNLTGNMRRYVWSMNNRVLSQSDIIKIKKGETVRIHLNNTTMMHHPMHLHGHFFRVLNKQGEYSPLKHTVDVPPMQTVVIEFNPEEKGDWIFHCHVLYHMKSGMSRVFRHGERDPRLANYPISKSLNMDKQWYMWGELHAMSNRADLELAFSNTKNKISMEGTTSWVDENYRFDEKWEGSASYERFLNNNFRLYAEIEIKNEDRFESSGYDFRGLPDIPFLEKETYKIGFRYLLPYFFEWDVSITSHFLIEMSLEYELLLFPRTEFFAEWEWLVYSPELSNFSDMNWLQEHEWSIGLHYMLSKNFSFIASYHNHYSYGAGISWQF